MPISTGLNIAYPFDLSDEIGQRIHQNRLLKNRPRRRTNATTDLAKFENKRRYATLVALMIESKATIIDEIIDLHVTILYAESLTKPEQTPTVFYRLGKGYQSNHTGI